MRRPAGTQLEYHLLVLVTLGLVAFGLVMVYSASSARRALRGRPRLLPEAPGDLRVVGLVALVVLSRIDYRACALGGPAVLAPASSLLVAVLVIGTAVNGARRWIPIGGSRFPALRAREARARALDGGVPRARPAPRRSASSLRPIGLVVGLACALILIEPDLGTAIAIAIMVAAMLVVSGRRCALLAGGRRIASASSRRASGSSPTAARGSSASSTRGTIRTAPASRPCRR